MNTMYSFKEALCILKICYLVKKRGKRTVLVPCVCEERKKRIYIGLKYMEEKLTFHSLAFRILRCVDVVIFKKKFLKGNRGIVGFLHENTFSVLSGRHPFN